MSAPQQVENNNNNSNNNNVAGGGCPVNHAGNGDPVDGGSTTGSSFWSWWNVSTTESSSSSSKTGATSRKEEYATSCPVATATATATATAASLEEVARHAQTPQPDQTIKLGLERQVSSIPRSRNCNHQLSSNDDADGVSKSKNQQDGLPHHQPNSNDKWVYPSEQQLYNAMRKKGWSNVPEDSITTVLQIHNHINEHTWGQIRAWEGCTTTKPGNEEDDQDELVLTRFQGRPRDLTPKAFFLSRIWGSCDPPFDRHDWYVARASANGNGASGAATTTGAEQRYVIDYYYLPPPQPHLPPIPYVDARPALDHPRALYLRGRSFFQSAFPGIAALLQQQPQQ